MFAAMTPGSNHTLAISRKGIERNCCVLYRQQKPKSERICHFSGSRTKDHRHTKSPCLKTCLTFCFKDRVRMEQREPSVDSHAEGTEGRLRELASKWFIDTQVPLIVRNGFFPTWFLGFITRKDAEEILRDKELGCFLIRLSDKAIGYILSYKGSDRCRHFVINQSESGQFVVCGDTEQHDKVSDLIEYYKTSPIEPFGEYLTSSCFEALNEGLYDIIQVNPKEQPVGTVRAVKNTRKQQMNPAQEQPPVRPRKNNRTLEEVPPLPRRNRHLDGLNDQDRVLYAQLRKQSPREIHICQDHLPGDNPGRAERSTTQSQNISRCRPPSEPDSVYSELDLLDSKSRSLPLLNNNSSDREQYRLSAPPNTPPRLSPKPFRQATHYSPSPEKTDSCSRPSSTHSLEYMSDNAVYHLAGRPDSPHTTSFETRTSSEQSQSLYAEVTSEALVARFPQENTYELIPGLVDTAKLKPNRLEDMGPKHNHSSWGLKNEKWKWLFPEVKRKW
ncbi:SH2 domain-containing protein 7-like [Micropterus salmoides]|uniref:SH2 domain-containing protein 7-like n=1 Tax=Micropterus salmoides TaxID=27706 RepID=UPI0018ECCB2A|nr:SH2 domain-containing protein 7-like [Micropterus salmoides]XP_038561992.1 SH2 domain-containing protein 7-like [Micropterus salmoides]